MAIPFCYSIATAPKTVRPSIQDPNSLVERTIAEPMKVLIQNCKIAGTLAAGSRLGYMYHHDNEIPEDLEGFDIRYADYQEKKDFLAYVTQKIAEKSVEYHDRSLSNDRDRDTGSTSPGSVSTKPEVANSKTGGDSQTPTGDVA